MLLRVLVVLLACMNLGVGLWWALHNEPAPPPPAATDPGVGSLVLLSESPRAAPAASAELSADPEPLAAGSACLSIGPFSDSAALRAAMNTLLPRMEQAAQWWIDLAAAPGFDWKAELAGQRSDRLQAQSAPCR